MNKCYKTMDNAGEVKETVCSNILEKTNSHTGSMWPAKTQTIQNTRRMV